MRVVTCGAWAAVEGMRFQSCKLTAFQLRAEPILRAEGRAKDGPPKAIGHPTQAELGWGTRIFQRIEFLIWRTTERTDETGV